MSTGGKAEGPQVPRTINSDQNPRQSPKGAACGLLLTGRANGGALARYAYAPATGTS
jgi:hypothetical protein